MGERELTDVTDTLRELSRKELVRPARRSSIEGEAEYAFWHILARDVAYGQLPRASRASRHVAAARWIESKAPERVEDLADVLAYHYATALELARAAGQTEQAADLEAPALKFLSLAGERAIGLDTAAALSNLERALTLAPPGHPERPGALARFGEAANECRALRRGGRVPWRRRSPRSGRRAISPPPPARWANSAALFHPGDPRGPLPMEALELLEPLGPSPELVAALTAVAARRRPPGQVRCRARARRPGAGDLAPTRPRATRPRSRLPGSRPRRPRGRGGLDDYREAIALATEAGQGREVALLHNNLGVQLWSFDGPGVSSTCARLALRSPGHGV